MSGIHATLSPSSAARWLNCIGAPAFEATIQIHTKQDNTFADEGTAAHYLAEQCLTSERHPSEFIGQTIYVREDGCYFLDSTPVIKGTNEFVVDADMAGYVNTYVQAIRDYSKGGDLEVETRVPIDHLTGEKGARGTIDARVVTADEELQIHDLKYGRGVEVFAEANEQLLMYAAASLNKFRLVYDIKTVRLVIHQPRMKRGPNEWVCSIDYLNNFAQSVKVRSGSARACFGLPIKVLKNYLAPGDKQCKWCSAKAACPKLSEFVQEEIGASFDKVENLSLPDDLSCAMKATDLIEDWIKAVRGEVESRLLQGVPVAGFKLVEGRAGNRSWESETEVEKALTEMQLKKEEMYTYKLISPTQAEKLLKKDKPDQWGKLQKYLQRKEGKPCVAPESDPRPVYDPTTNFESLI